MMKHRPRARWELYVRPAVAAVFIVIYWAHHDAYPPDPAPPQPPARTTCDGDCGLCPGGYYRPGCPWKIGP